MKKLLSGLLLGFLLHKGLTGLYHYQWWSAEAVCRPDKGNSAEPIACIYEKLGSWEYLGLVISQPTYAYQQWSMRY